LTLFVWSKSRVVPVRITDFSITEEAFDTQLNPIRAKVSLGMRVLNIDDLGFQHPGGHYFMAYLSNKESLATKAKSVALNVLGLGGLP
jgi:3-polyprenyl-4-hydroxybenzoate decarboxylase